MLEALGRLAGQGHLKLWINDPKTQRVLDDFPLDGFPLAGRVPQSSRAYSAVFVSNSLGSRLDAYLTE